MTHKIYRREWLYYLPPLSNIPFNNNKYKIIALADAYFKELGIYNKWIPKKQLREVLSQKVLLSCGINQAPKNTRARMYALFKNDYHKYIEFIKKNGQADVTAWDAYLSRRHGFRAKAKSSVPYQIAKATGLVAKANQELLDFRAPKFMIGQIIGELKFSFGAHGAEMEDWPLPDLPFNFALVTVLDENQWLKFRLRGTPNGRNWRARKYRQDLNPLADTMELIVPQAETIKKPKMIEIAAPHTHAAVLKQYGYILQNKTTGPNPQHPNQTSTLTSSWKGKGVQITIDHLQHTFAVIGKSPLPIGKKNVNLISYLNGI